MQSGAETMVARAKHTCVASVAKCSSALQRREIASWSTIDKNLINEEKKEEEENNEENNEKCSDDSL